jgi:large subunit ribosomal protein L15
MKLNELKPSDGAVTKRMRVGRGIGSGKGKTCGRGHKGQKSRSGVAIKGFEGGQMPLYRRLPKRGFHNRFEKNFATVSLGRLQQAVDKKMLDPKKPVDEDILVASKVIRRKLDGVRLLGGGELKAKLDLKLRGGATKAAQAAVEKAGGKFELVEHVVAPVKKRGEKDKTKAKKTVTRAEKKAAKKK